MFFGVGKRKKSSRKQEGSRGREGDMDYKVQITSFMGFWYSQRKSHKTQDMNRDTGDGVFRSC